MTQEATGPLEPAQPTSVEALLLTCFDYRFVGVVEPYMQGRGLRGQYDHVILAGASLGALTDQFPAWTTAFFEQLDLAKRFHDVKRVILMDHRDCKAYGMVLGQDFAQDPIAELSVHAAQMQRLREAIRARHPELAVELLLVSLDGSVTDLS